MEDYLGFGVRFLVGVRELSVLRNVQTDSGPCLATCTMSTGAVFPEIMRPGREAHYSPPYTAEIKQDGLIVSHPPVGLAATIKHSDKFNFNFLLTNYFHSSRPHRIC
jgi:hypothetical protein